MDEELRWTDAVGQAELVRSGAISPNELLDAGRDRIREIDPVLHCIVAHLEPGAEGPADDSEADAPFPGVPFLVKDLSLEIAGAPFTEGSRWLKDNVSSHDQELVRRYRQAGLAILGKTNIPEFGLTPHCEPVLHGATRNPWNLSLSTSGSSGGSAAAVASGMVPMAHGNDLGGSLRYPAAWCGVFGFKPTRGRVPMGPEYGDVAGGFAVEHALTRSVRDSAALLDATAGQALGDPYWAPPQARPFLLETGTVPGKLRIAATATPNSGQHVHPDYLRVFEETVELLAGLGHSVTDAHPGTLGRAGHRAVRAVYGGAIAWIEAYWTQRMGRPPEAGEIEPFTAADFERSRAVTGGQYLLGMEELQRFSRRLAGFFEEFDAWMTPTVGWPPLPLGTLVGTEEEPLRGEREASRFLMFDGEYANISGNPAMSVPLGVDSTGLPVGMSFLGRFGDEATLFRLAGQLEKAAPWADRKPEALARALSASL
ncbi:amidase [Arthrobacter sp. AZCC_0090]|uniref:amidase n=1 Tax=Arthrobacter sp. AZCC_0090 TaxID=2735881 RepID=UPI00160D9E09|nr:amidase [Arthrobacter sp. AZCC_0090]MBB6404679.1 amidase [Arthrobacter sp. AZCC_0090]